MGRKAFQDFIQIQRLRNGAWVDNKMVSVLFDLVVGPFTFPNVTMHWKSGSIRLHAGKARVKGNYVPIIREIVKKEVIYFRNSIDKSNSSDILVTVVKEN